MGWAIIFWAVIGALVGRAIGKAKGRANEGLLLGLFLGFIGWIIIAVMRPTPEAEAERVQAVASFMDPNSASRRACPYCAEQIQSAAVVCRFCGRDVEPVAARPVAQQGIADQRWADRPGGTVQCPMCGMWIASSEKTQHVKAKHRW
jgi:hypothetical protein